MVFYRNLEYGLLKIWLTIGIFRQNKIGLGFGFRGCNFIGIGLVSLCHFPKSGISSSQGLGGRRRDGSQVIGLRLDSMGPGWVGQIGQNGGTIGSDSGRMGRERAAAGGRQTENLFSVATGLASRSEQKSAAAAAGLLASSRRGIFALRRRTGVAERRRGGGGGGGGREGQS